MKKLFLFIVLLFSLFFINPTDTFAYTYVPEDIKISFYNSNGQVDNCLGLKQCYNFLPGKIASRVQIQSNKISFIEGKSYKMYVSLKLSVPTDYSIYDFYLSDYNVRNYTINVDSSNYTYLYWDDFGWFNVYQWDLVMTVTPTFQGTGTSFDFYKNQAYDQEIWILDVLDFHSELLADSSDTNVIIDNQNKNTQDIIDNQNKNTQEQIESEKVCKIYDFTKETLPVGVENYFLNPQGQLYPSATTKTSDYIEVSKDTYYYYSSNASSSTSFCLYDNSKTLIQCYSYEIGEHQIKPVQDGFIRLSWWNDWSTLTFRGKYCKNGNQALDDSINNLENAITDDSSPDLSGLDNSAGWLPAGPVDSIINLPLSLFQNLTDNLSKTCQPVTLTLPYVNRNIILPCISSLYAKIGVQDFLNWVGVIVSCLLLYNYFLRLYKWIDDTLTFRENNWQDWGGV